LSYSYRGLYIGTENSFAAKKHLVFLQTLEMDDAQLENIPKLIKARGGPYVIKFLQGDVPEFLLKEMEEAAHAEANPDP